MKVTSSQQMMSIGDFPLPINDKQKEPHSVQRKSVRSKPNTLNNATKVLLNEKEQERLPCMTAVADNIT